MVNLHRLGGLSMIWFIFPMDNAQNNGIGRGFDLILFKLWGLKMSTGHGY